MKWKENMKRFGARAYILSGILFAFLASQTSGMLNGYLFLLNCLMVGVCLATAAYLRFVLKRDNP